MYPLDSETAITNKEAKRARNPVHTVYRLSKWGYEVEAYADGASAYEALVRPDSARLAILDWKMPGLWGIEICRKVRAIAELPFRHLILLTARDSEADIVAALEAGANDYITKPWNPGELRARLGVGERMLLVSVYRGRQRDRVGAT